MIIINIFSPTKYIYIFFSLMVWCIRCTPSMQCECSQGSQWTSLPISPWHYILPLSGLYFLEDPPESFHYLSQSGCLKDKSLNDKELFNSVMVSVTAFTLFVFSQSLSSKIGPFVNVSGRLTFTISWLSRFPPTNKPITVYNVIVS